MVLEEGVESRTDIENKQVIDSAIRAMFMIRPTVSWYCTDRQGSDWANLGGFQYLQNRLQSFSGHAVK